MNKVLFISEVSSPSICNSSTDIMTETILRGLKENAHVTFIAICENKKWKKELLDYYNKYSDDTYVVDGFFWGKQNKYLYFLRLVLNTFFKGKYRKRLSDLNEKEKSFDLIISHCGVYESVLFATVIKEKQHNTPYYQFWSDPMSLSGITYEQFFHKPSRRLFYYFEKKALGYCDKIIYGTKPLFDIQKKLFPQQKQKMSYIDIPYTYQCASLINDEMFSDNMFIYSGNYFSKIRNILPLIEAFSYNNKIKLDIYGNSDLNIECPQNVFIHNRVSLDEIQRIETKYKTLFCLLNKNCEQIPGKIFYSMIIPAHIIVVVEDSTSQGIIDYLRRFNRFIICNNTPKSIAKSIFSSRNESIDLESIKASYSPKNVCLCLLNGGKNE